ncbi:MAG: BON domain-containing protein [Phycisphaerales bacterium]|nr:BON domain-containing protein [Phycisphaerales bacterium]
MPTSMKLFSAALLLGATMTACDKSDTNNHTASNVPKDAVRQADGTYRYADGSIHNSDGSTVSSAPRREARDTNADSRDAAKNDWSDKPPTPDGKPTKPDSVQQGNNQADLDVTQAIRKALVARDGMSMAAKNITIVTEKGTVTLKGEVASDAEKAAIAEIASANAAGRTVDNQLSVAPPAQPK